MERATLGGLLGAAEVRSRLKSETDHEYRGTFAFRSSDEPAILRLLDSREVVEFEGPIHGEQKRLQAFLTDVSLERGLVYFQGKGDPY